MKGIVVGLGGWGWSWVQVLRDSGWEISAWVDVNETALKRAVDELGADPSRCHKTLGDAIRQTKADAAFIFTPPIAARADDITAAMDAGLHVLAEKPLISTTDELRMVLDRHKTCGVKLMVGQGYRWFPGAKAMREAVVAGGLGDLGYMNVLYHMALNMPGAHVATMEDAMILAMSIHHLDTMRFVIGSEPESVLAKGWNPPWSWCKCNGCVESLFTFPGGKRVNYFSGWSARRNETDWFGHWDLEFEKGSLWTDGVKSSVFADGGRTDTAGPEINATHTRYDVLREFTASIEENREPECSLADNVKTLMMAFGIIESSRTGSEVDLREFAEKSGLLC